MYYQYENAENVLCFYVKNFKNQMDGFILEAHINKLFLVESRRVNNPWSPHQAHLPTSCGTVCADMKIFGVNRMKSTIVNCDIKNRRLFLNSDNEMGRSTLPKNVSMHLILSGRF